MQFGLRETDPDGVTSTYGDGPGRRAADWRPQPSVSSLTSCSYAGEAGRLEELASALVPAAPAAPGAARATDWFGSYVAPNSPKPKATNAVAFHFFPPNSPPRPVPSRRTAQTPKPYQPIPPAAAAAVHGARPCRPKLEPYASASTSAAQHQHQRGDDDYVSGNIMEIELCNFMTYDRLVSRPGPRLNLVVGPNGSGKSSLVCAIALALATDPSILGRASSVRAFVKRGEESDHVRLSLRSQSQASDIHITRKVDTNNKSEWLLDGTSVPKKDIIDVIKKFNIQINNLTQFLPQDRVCEFAKLTPIQLLEETEKAVGDPNLPVQHRQLIERSRELRNIEVVNINPSMFSLFNI
ncbi:structural maintenance of chromosomes protein 5-like [Hordeum vulgare subsp. vulgare]|uniref:structural maintenance of chromosomes protein 5-like n=1 Tax=Hordeum vulgare subsp. vulgare TaxID=112509 RepID=UPI001D1A5961|nr:structural maintenance of chromosomes protein 5-like [Hordeum vulgare subsp. vulgare]